MSTTTTTSDGATPPADAKAKSRRSSRAPEESIPDRPENQNAREFLKHAPSKGLWMPLGKQVKVMQCWRCKAFGHRTGDRECPLASAGNLLLDAERQAREDPMARVLAQSQSQIAEDQAIQDRATAKALAKLTRRQQRQELEELLREVREELREKEKKKKKHSKKSSKKKKKKKTKTTTKRYESSSSSSDSSASDSDSSSSSSSDEDRHKRRRRRRRSRGG